MIAHCQIEHRQGVPAPFSIVNVAGSDPYIYVRGGLDDVLRTFRSVVGALEIAADELTDAYDLTLGDSIEADVRPSGSSVKVVLRCFRFKEVGE